VRTRKVLRGLEIKTAKYETYVQYLRSDGIAFSVRAEYDSSLRKPYIFRIYAENNKYDNTHVLFDESYSQYLSISRNAPEEGGQPRVSVVFSRSEEMPPDELKSLLLALKVKCTNDKYPLWYIWDGQGKFGEGMYYDSKEQAMRVLRQCPKTALLYMKRTQGSPLELVG